MRRVQVGTAAAAGRRARFLCDVAERAHSDAGGVEGGGAGHGAREAGDEICPWDFQAEMRMIAGVLVRTARLVCVYGCCTSELQMECWERGVRKING